MYEHLESFITAFIGEKGMCHKMPRERIVPSEVAVYGYLKRLGIANPKESEVKALVKALSEKFSGETGAIIVGDGDEQVIYWFQIQPVIAKEEA